MLFILNYVHVEKNCKCSSAMIKIYSYSVDVNRLRRWRPGPEQAAAALGANLYELETSAKVS